MPPCVNREAIAAVAQAEYDNWFGLNGWGCCQQIAEAVGRTMSDGVRWMTFDLDSDPPHTVLRCLSDGVTFEVDVDWTVYEYYRKGKWWKIHGATITAQHVRVRLLEGEERAECLFCLDSIKDDKDRQFSGSVLTATDLGASQ